MRPNKKTNIQNYMNFLIRNLSKATIKENKNFEIRHLIKMGSYISQKITKENERKLEQLFIEAKD
jgi:hypothetical protein